MKTTLSTRVLSLLIAAVLSASALGDAFHPDAPGLTLYVRVFTSATASVAAALTEGTGGAVGLYYVTDANLLAAGLSSASTTTHPDGFVGKVFSGTPSTTANDPWRGNIVIPWNGTAAMRTPVDLRTIEGSDATDQLEAAVTAVLEGASVDFSPGTLAQIAAANWAALTSGLTTPGSVGAYVLDNLDAKVSTVGAGISPALYDEDHIWGFDSRSQVVSPQIITENQLFNGLVVMDFTEPMPAAATIAAISSVSITPPTGGAVIAPTLGTAAKSTDQKKAILPLDATTATKGKYTLLFVITTTDSQVIPRKGVLELK